MALSQGSPTLFFLHPAGGTTVCYVDLARRLAPYGIVGVNYPSASIGKGGYRCIKSLSLTMSRLSVRR